MLEICPSIHCSVPARQLKLETNHDRLETVLLSSGMCFCSSVKDLAKVSPSLPSSSHFSCHRFSFSITCWFSTSFSFSISLSHSGRVFPKPCPRAEIRWLENTLILLWVLPNPGLLKRGIKMLYSTTHGWIPSVYQTAYCTQTHHEFSRAHLCLWAGEL